MWAFAPPTSAITPPPPTRPMGLLHLACVLRTTAPMEHWTRHRAWFIVVSMKQRQIDITVSSELSASPETLWARASTMEGVNLELGPWVQMSVPAEARGQRLEEAPLGEVAFHSWLLLGGFCPSTATRFSSRGSGPGRAFGRSRRRGCNDAGSTSGACGRSEVARVVC